MNPHPPLLIESWLPIAAVGAESQRETRHVERVAATLLPARVVGAAATDRQPRGDPGGRAARVVGGLAGGLAGQVSQ